MIGGQCCERCDFRLPAWLLVQVLANGNSLQCWLCEECLCDRVQDLSVGQLYPDIRALSVVRI